MKKFALIGSLIGIALTVIAGSADLDQKISTPKTAIPGNLQANVPVMTNTTEIVAEITTNLVKQKIQISLNNCIWDPTTKILYERTIKDNKLFYIAVTNVDLISQGLPLNK